MSARPTVLHVDDDRTMLDLSSDWASDEGLTWLTASDPAAALTLLSDNDVDCLVSDSLRTPDGDSFVDRATDADPDLPVVLFTATDRDAVAPDTRRVASGYVRKGTTDQFSALLERVSALVADQPSGHSAADGGDDWELVGHHDWDGAGTDLATTIVTAVEEHTERDVSTAAPLYESIDAEILESLLRRPEGEPRTGIRVRFPFAGHELAVASDGRILLRSATA
ncbi:HalOD1 output domain-containing protein [Haloplanus halophilus]|uniref:HalOD1 output domain-containing protein n=1 Tax=Haloplanus halophilus TaxID=2949993 RepID=UPI00203B47AE|nr:HalOD1 output domain-containing protein [Haloplanus sp. GDY1]